MGLFGNFGKAAADMAKSATGGITGVKDDIAALTTDLARRTPDIGDALTLTALIEKIPGVAFERREADTALLDRTLLLVQLGSVSLIVTFDDENKTGAELVTMDIVPASEKFSATCTGQDNDGKTTSQILVNNAHWAQNHEAVTVDLLVKALMQPVANVPLIGGALVGLIEWPARKVAGFLLSTVYEQSNRALNIVKGPGPQTA